MSQSDEKSKVNFAMHAYIIMLHLRSQGWTDFTEIRKLFCWKHFKQAVAIESVGYINSNPSCYLYPNSCFILVAITNKSTFNSKPAADTA